MKKITITALSILLAICFVATGLVCGVSAVESPNVASGSVEMIDDSSFTVAIGIENNPGFAYLRVNLEYDTDVLTLTSVVNSAIGMVMAKGETISWDNTENYTGEALCVLTFTVAENAAAGDYAINILIEECYDEDTDDVRLGGGSVTFTVGPAELPDNLGDVNEDGSISLVDLLLLRKYIANFDYDTGESDVTVSSGADANYDGVIDCNDAILLCKYLVNYNYETGESTVTFGPQES